jgi:hypothetical protein
MENRSRKRLKRQEAERIEARHDRQDVKRKISTKEPRK